MNEVIDPVCGMKIDAASAAGTSTVNGTTFHFCASVCKTRFDADPERYAGDCCSEPAASCCGAGSSCCR